MSSVDLNIIERGLKGQSWTAEKGPITAGDLAKISEQRTNSSGALNALPTPFARFFVVKEAFRRALEEVKNTSKSAGEAYNRLVSDTLDVFELLYNLTYHEARWGAAKVVIREWDSNVDLKRLKNQVPILGDAVANYINGDLKASKDRLFFIVLETEGRDYLLATSSPYTGFITPPDLDKKTGRTDRNALSFIGERYKNMPVINRRNSGGSYFRDIKMLGQRDKDFKNYMFYLVDKNEIGAEFNELRNYIKQIAIADVDINNNWQPQLKHIVSENSNNLIINGLPIFKDSGLSTVNFFCDTLVRVPFRLSKNFYSMKFAGEDKERDFDYLLPLNKDALALIDSEFMCVCKITNTKVIVTLNYKGQEYSKDYYVNDYEDRNRGRIVNLSKENISLNLGIFPNILSTNSLENNYFKVMAVTHDATTEYRHVQIDSLALSFFKKNESNSFEEIETIEESNTFAKYGIRPGVVRSKQDEQNEVYAGSKFYEIFNSQFDAIHLHFALDSGACEGLLVVNWSRAQLTQDAYTYAVDLGTTNTYISCCKAGLDNEPEQLHMNEPMVSFLHDVKPSAQHSLVTLIESGIASLCKKNFASEFVPPLIDGTVHRFPIRTALCVNKANKSNPSLFDNCNIAFFYEKAKGLGNQSILTDIKWEGSHEKELRLFIRELLLLIKADILQKNGQLAKTNIIWFRPLSFKGDVRDLYSKIWNEEAKKILNVNNSQIECISESEAPYYYFNKKNSFNSVDSVSIVDIGGGSSDFIYFADGKPIIANSVHFGCDILWGNGFSGFDNDRDSNGIYKYFADTLHLGSHETELEQLNIKMKNDKSVTTKDIINFWLSNDAHCNISRQLKDNYKPLFLYHFASIVFFMAKMYESKKLESPRSILFCGNGSRYIDSLLSTDKKVIKLLVTKIFEFVYGNPVKDIQVILPEGRKECTCYGGLYRKSDVEVPSEFNFQGVSDKEYANVEELKLDFDNLSRTLLATHGDFNKLYIELLKQLIGNGEIDYQVDINEIQGLISSSVQDSLDKNFKIQVVQSLNDSEPYHDSIFFFPIIDNIIKLTHLKK